MVGQPAAGVNPWILSVRQQLWERVVCDLSDRFSSEQAQPAGGGEGLFVTGLSVSNARRRGQISWREWFALEVSDYPASYPMRA